jgi:ATP synthase protein I
MRNGEDPVRRERRDLEDRLDRKVQRMRRARQDQRTLFGQTVYLGTLGVLFILPVIGGAYLGRWIDDRLTGYAVHWTVSLILLGVLLGAVNVWLFIRE